MHSELCVFLFCTCIPSANEFHYSHHKIFSSWTKIIDFLFSFVCLVLWCWVFFVFVVCLFSSSFGRVYVWSSQREKHQSKRRCWGCNDVYQLTWKLSNRWQRLIPFLMVFSNKIELLLLLLTCFVKADPLIAVITLTLKGKDGGKLLHDRRSPSSCFH